MNPPTMNPQFDSLKDKLYADEQDDFTPLKDMITSMNPSDVRRNLPRILPVSLKLLDHHMTRNKILGVSCVDYIVTSLPIQDMISTGSDALIIHSLRSCLFYPDISVVSATLPVLVKGLKSFPCVTSGDKDDVMDEVIKGLEMSTSNESKAVYWKYTRQLISLVGLSVLRFSGRLIRRISDQLTYPLTSESTCVCLFSEVLKSIEEFVLTVNERGISKYTPTLLFAIMSFSYANHTLLVSDSCKDVYKNLLTAVDTIKNTDSKTLESVMDIINKNDEDQRLKSLFS